MNTLTFLRQFRIIDFAIFDLVAAFLGVFLLAPLLSKIFRKINIEIPKKNWLFLTLPIGIITHIAIGQSTPMTDNFFDPSGHYFLKIVIIFLSVLGLRGIKRVKMAVKL